jgi:hypothetical protein
MKTRVSARTLLTCVAASGADAALLARARCRTRRERLSDREVKQLVEDVDQARDRFEDQLDGNLKSSILRTPTGELSSRGTCRTCRTT